MMALSLIVLLVALLGLFAVVVGIMVTKDEPWRKSNEAGIMFFVAVVAVCGFVHYNIPTRHGIAYFSPDAIIKTNGTTIVLYDNCKQIFTSTDTKWYFASNEAIRVEWRSNTNLWGRTVKPWVTVVLK